jgi:thioredoxin 1/putative thioredoxin
MLIGGNRQAAGAPTGEVPYVTERDFEKEVLRSELPVLIEFTADWCQPCKQIAPEVDAFAKETAGKVKVVKVDIDKNQMLTRQLRIQSVPTFMLLVGGRPADLQVGAMGRKELRAMVEPFLPRQEGALKPAELAQLIAQGQAVAVDTRDAAAFGRAHVPRSKNIPLEEIEGRLAELYMLGGAPVLYCRSGDKSKELASRLAEQGVETAFLEGGFLAWEGDGLPVERP